MLAFPAAMDVQLRSVVGVESVLRETKKVV